MSTPRKAASTDFMLWPRFYCRDASDASPSRGQEEKDCDENGSKQRRMKDISTWGCFAPTFEISCTCVIVRHHASRHPVSDQNLKFEEGFVNFVAILSKME